MTETPDNLPPALETKIAEIDQGIAIYEEQISGAEEGIQLLNRDRQVLLDTAALCYAAWCGNEAAANSAHKDASLNVSLGEPNQPPSRQRRDIRGEVLAFLASNGKRTWRDYEISANLGIRSSQAEASLAYHERDGRIERHPPGMRGWRLKQVPKAEVVDPTASEAPHEPKADWLGIGSRATAEETLDFMRQATGPVSREQLAAYTTPGVIATLIARGDIAFDETHYRLREAAE